MKLFLILCALVFSFGCAHKNSTEPVAIKPVKKQSRMPAGETERAELIVREYMRLRSENEGLALKGPPFEAFNFATTHISNSPYIYAIVLAADVSSPNGRQVFLLRIREASEQNEMIAYVQSCYKNEDFDRSLTADDSAAYIKNELAEAEVPSVFSEACGRATRLIQKDLR